jgi:hypothetical protein
MASHDPNLEFMVKFARLSFCSERPDGAVGLSIKVRPTGGCFHRDHSPRAYEIIDREFASIPDDERDFIFEEHESGPEIVLYVVAGVNVATSAFNFLTAIIKARSEGILKGDGRTDPLDVQIRGINKNNQAVKERTILQVDCRERLMEIQLREALDKAITEEFGEP